MTMTPDTAAGIGVELLVAATTPDTLTGNAAFTRVRRPARTGTARCP